MILKIRTMCNAEPSWTILANIKNVTYRKINKEDREHKRFAPDYYIKALDRNSKIDITMLDYIYVTAERPETERRNWGGIVTICSNMVIYLLNDEGKTIERIN